MNSLKEIKNKLSDVSTKFYNLYCNPSKCGKCEFGSSCFASLLDDIEDDIDNVQNSLNKMVGNNNGE